MSPFATLIVLLGGTAVLLMGSGLFSTLLGVRASLEAFGPTVIGAIMSAYFFGFILGSSLCVRAVGRVGHIRTLAALSAILSAIAIAHAIFVNPFVWGAFRLITGVCLVGCFMVIESWLNSVTPAPLRGRVFSIYMIVNLSAVATGQFLLVLAAPRDFTLFGVVSILFALSLVPTALARVDAPPPQEVSRLSARELCRASPVGVAGALTSGFIAGTFWGMGAVFAAKLGLSTAGIAGFMSSVIIGGMLAQWPVGSLSDRIDRRKVIIGMAVIGALASALIAVATMVSLIAFFAFAVVFGASMLTLYPLAVARTHDVLGAEKVLEATRGLILVFGIGAACGPFAAGWIMSEIAPFALFALSATIMALFAAFAFYRVLRGEGVPATEQSTFVPLLRTSEEAVEMAETANVTTEPAE